MRQDMYNDNAGHCMIGIGHLIHPGNCIVPLFAKNATQSQLRPEQRQYLMLEAPFHQPLSRAAAVNLFKKDVAAVESVVSDRVTVALDQPQFDALVSFTFNVGMVGFANSTLIKKLNAGRYPDVPDEMKRWVKSTTNGVQAVNANLVRRRAREADLFQNGHY
jgi:GH24 family phage-related lysozyme (muramidase)